MLHKKIGTESDNAIRASVKKEMAEPRIAKSARIPEPQSTKLKTGDHVEFMVAKPKKFNR
jgi:hypothetical protein